MLISEVLTHVGLDEEGVAWIDDTGVKVIEIAMSHLANGWSAEDIHREYPSISLAQVYAALAFYYDHQPEFDDAIAKSAANAEKLAAANVDSPGRRRLRAMDHRH